MTDQVAQQVHVLSSSACTFTCQLRVAVLQNPVLVEHALRQTLAADALSLQFKLPAPGVAPAMAHASASIACGTAVIDALAVTSVWVVQVLRALCAVSEAFSFPLQMLCRAKLSTNAFMHVPVDLCVLVPRQMKPSACPEALQGCPYSHQRYAVQAIYQCTAWTALYHVGVTCTGSCTVAACPKSRLDQAQKSLRFDTVLQQSFACDTMDPG